MFFSRIAFALVLIEMLVLFAVIGEIGFFAAFGLWALSAVIGVWLIQEQGLATMRRAQESFNRGVLPMGDMFESLCLLGAGLLLIMPGFVSDVVAAALLVPSFRNLARRRGAKIFGLKEQQQPQPTYDDGVIDGVYERVPERNERISPKNLEN